MKSMIARAVSFIVVTVTAAPDPLITPRTELTPRQTSSEYDPALVGWVDATDGQCKPPSNIVSNITPSHLAPTSSLTML
jgi:hypothetical protein